MQIPIQAQPVMRNVSSVNMINSGVMPSGLCEDACNTAERVAKGACNLLPNWFGARRKCKRAADRAGDWCRSKC
jgi:hypothetical protein